MRRYLKLMTLFGKRDLIAQTAYRPTFVLAVISKIIAALLGVIFFQGIFAQVPAVGHYTFYDALLLVAILYLLNQLIGITYQRNLAYWFPQSLWKGNFDYTLTRPISTLFLVTFQTIDFFDVIAVIPWSVVIWYALSHIETPVTAGNIVLGIALFGSAFFFLFAVYLMVAAAAFWTTFGTGAGRLVEAFLRSASIPTDTLPNTVRVLFTFFLPVALLATLPTLALLGRLSAELALYAFVITVIAVIGAYSLWRRGLQHYVSVGG